MQYPPNTLSLCMIVKNEQSNIGPCLESVKDLPDEIIIVDTGSTDNTILIASKYTDKIYGINWQNDFSHARNIYLDRARCSWIYYMDADDRIDDQAIAGIKRLKNEVTEYNSAFGFLIKNIKSVGMGDQFFQIRMFPNDKRLRYEKKVHEQIAYSLKQYNYNIIYLPEITIQHTGYNDDTIRRKKALRNRKIIESDIMNYPNDPNYLAAYGDTFAMVEDWASAAPIYKSVLDIPNCRDLQKDIYESMFMSIGLCYKNLGKDNEARIWLVKGLAQCDNKINLYFLLAEICYKTKDYNQALYYYKRVYDNPFEYASTPIDNEGIKLKSIVQIGKIHQANGNYKEAKQWFKIVLGNYKNFNDMPGNMGELLLAEGNTNEAMTYFVESVTKFPGKDKRAYLRIAEIQDQLGMRSIAIPYLELAKKFFPNDLEIEDKLKELYIKQE